MDDLNQSQSEMPMPVEMQPPQGFEQQLSQEQQPDQLAQIAGLITDLDRRLRVLEERYSNLRKKLQLTDQNLIESERSYSKELKSLNDDTLQLKRNMNEFSDKIMLFDNEMQTVAQKSDLKAIEKYLAMWSPTNFVTRSELKDYLRNMTQREQS